MITFDLETKLLEGPTGWRANPYLRVACYFSRGRERMIISETLLYAKDQLSDPCWLRDARVVLLK